MKKNKLKRYSGIHELEKELEEMNNDGWVIQSISDTGNRMIVIYCKEYNDLNSNNVQDAGEDKKETIHSDNGGTSL